MFDYGMESATLLCHKLCDYGPILIETYSEEVWTSDEIFFRG